MSEVIKKRSIICILWLVMTLLLMGATPYGKITARAASKYSVRFYDTDLKHEYKSLAKHVASGSKIKLPVVKDKKGYTFLGWSTTSRKTSNPNYQAGQTVAVKRSLTLYAVWFKKSAENNITKSELARLNKYKYTRAILIGDSRTQNMEKTLNYQFGASSHAKVTFISGWGQGLSWFKHTASRLILNNLKKYGGGTKEKPIAIAINLGVNDCQNIYSYINSMKTLAANLRGYHCRFFYVSVNPVNSAVLASRGRYGRTEPKVIAFNSLIRSGLSSTFRYIDTYSVLIKNGYAFDSGAGRDTGYDDGVHYSTRTYKRIYNMILNSINKAG